MSNNPALYNAAFVGFLAGTLNGRDLEDPVAVDYAHTVALSTLFATEVDSLIPVDATLTAAGSTIAPTTGPITEKLLGKTALLQSVCQGFCNGKAFEAVTSAADFLQVATVIKGIYTEGLIGILSP